MIADAVYGHPAQRAAIAAVAAARRVPFHGIWLEAPLATAVDRVTHRTGDASDADAAIVRRQAETIDPATVTWRRTAADRPVEAIAAGVLGLVGRPMVS